MYIEPVLVCGWLTARAKFWMETPYKDGLSSQNEDIEDYLGKGRLSLQLEPSERLVGEVLLTRGDEFGLNYAAEVSWRPGKLDFFLFLQYYNGYGEELIDYNVETKSLRGGIRFN